MQSILRDSKNGDLFIEKAYVFDASGIKSELQNASNYYNWNSVIHLVGRDQTFYMYVNSIQAIIIPKAYMNDRIHIDEFRAYINLRMK